jgi:hypothetical protein
MSQLKSILMKVKKKEKDKIYKDYLLILISIKY